VRCGKERGWEGKDGRRGVEGLGRRRGEEEDEEEEEEG